MAQVVGGVQAPKYIYLPNATIRYNKLTYNYPIDTTPYKTYTRPVDWLDLPVVNEGDEVIYMLVAIYENNPNYIGLKVRGNYTVDWGNGDIQNYDSNSSTSSNDKINYSFDWNDFDESTITSDGYKQAIVKITPQVAGELTYFDLAIYHSPYNGIEAPILDIKMAGQNIDTIKLSSSLINLEQFEFVGSHSITNGYYMFNGSGIRKLVGFDMGGITNATNMFSNCTKLIELPNLDLSNVTNTNSMFLGCYDIERFPIFDIISTTNAYRMFYSCSSLREIEITGTENVQNMEDMFMNCSSLTKVVGLKTDSATTTKEMFSGCSKLYDLPQLNLQNCTITFNMFYYCLSIIKFDNGIINTPNIPNMNGMFGNCQSLIEIPKDFDASSCTDASYMFYNTISLRRIPNINTSNVLNATQMFNGSGILELPDLDFSNCTNMNSMFNRSKIQRLPESFNTSSCTNMYRMFYQCYDLVEIPSIDTSKNTNFNNMFGYSKVKSLPVIDFSSHNTTANSNPFVSCSQLTGITITNIQGTTSLYNFFSGCQSLTEVNIPDTSHVTKMYAMFQNCKSLLVAPNLNTSSCTDMSGMFNASGIKVAPVYDLTNVTTMSTMFYQCPNLEHIPSMNTSNVTNMYRMCYNTSRIKTIGTLDMSSLNTTSAANLIFNSVGNVYKSGIVGLKYTHTYNSANLVHSELINIFNNLGNATSQTIDVRYNPGTADLTPTDIAIATSKGWTVTV
jgi:surface protein